MAELMEPFERELRRSRRTTPQTERWFEDDMARALSELEARTGTARTYGALQPGDAEAGIIAREAPQRTQAMTIGEMIENPVREAENPDAVRRELIDPLVRAYGMESQVPLRSMRPLPQPAAPRIVKSGSDIYMEDPLTRQLNLVKSGPQPQPKLSAREQSDLRDIEGEIKSVRAQLAKAPDLDSQLPFQNRILALDKKRRRLFPQGAAIEAEVTDVEQVPEAPAVQEEFVSVVNPSGKATRIKASDLQRALKSGYKRR